MPYTYCTDEPAKCNGPGSFCDFRSFLSFYDRSYDGIGLGISNGFCAIDTDDCVDENGELSETAHDIIETMHAYSEYSPSRSGIHILFKADGFSYDTSRYHIMNHKTGLEVYVSGTTNEYVTVIGIRIGDNLCFNQSFGDRSDELRQVLEKYMLRPQVQASRILLLNLMQKIRFCPMMSSFSTSPRTVELMMPFANFGRVILPGYPSHSEANMVLGSRLAFWAQKNASRMDSLFRHSGLMRDKWARRQSPSTYGEFTVRHALDACHGIYTPPRKPPLAFSSKPQLGCNPPVFQPFVPLKPITDILRPFLWMRFPQ